MLCGLSINSWAQCTTAPTIVGNVVTPVIGTAGTTVYPTVPSQATVIAGSTVKLTVESYAGSGCTIQNFQWQYFSGGIWNNFTDGAFPGSTGTATITNSVELNGSPSASYANVFTIANIPANIPAAYLSNNNGSLALEISATATDNDGLGDSARSNTVTLKVVETEGWIPDSPGNDLVSSGTIGFNYPFGPLPSSGGGTYEQGTLLPSGHLLAFGYNPNAGNQALNVDVTPGTGSGVPDLWTTSNYSLPNPLQRPTTTLLPTGSVLIAGGLQGVQDLSASWLWSEGHNGIGGAWTPGNDNLGGTGPLHTARDAATATLLDNGLVLVAGGSSNGRVLTSAELYNPATGTWSAAGSLKSPRYHHTATLLTNGEVLIVGGNNTTGANTLDSAELYNPATNTFTLLQGTLWAQRAYHAATLLQDGNVLITGGVDEAGQPLSLAEIYNLADGSFYEITSTTGSSAVPLARSQHTATLLANGKVLIAGGVGSVVLPNTAIQDLWLTESEYFDPTNGGVNPAGDDTAGKFAVTSNAAGSVILNNARDRQGAWLVPSGLVVAAGGTTGDVTYDAAKDTTTPGETIVPTAEKFGDQTEFTGGASLVPVPAIHIAFSQSPVYVGQTITATCGPAQAGALPQNWINYAWVIESGASLTGNPTKDYPNWSTTPGDSSEIQFLVTGTSGPVTISCLATNIYGIPSFTSDFVAEATVPIGGTTPLSLTIISSPEETDGSGNPNFGTPGIYTTIPAGSSVTFVSALTQPTSPTYTYSYQWYDQAGPVGTSSPSNSSLSLTGVPVTSDGNVYWVVATGTGAENAGGTVTSNKLTLHVVGAPVVATTTGLDNMGPVVGHQTCTYPIAPGTSKTPCDVDESGEAAFTVSITPSPVGALTDENYQWCVQTQNAAQQWQTPTPFIGSGTTNLASNLCSPNLPAPSTSTAAGTFRFDAPPYTNYTAFPITYTPPPAVGISAPYYAVAYDTILGVAGAPSFSTPATQTVYGASPVVITNSTSCPKSGFTTPAACATAGAPQYDPTVDDGSSITLTATFTGTSYPLLNTDATYEYAWVYKNSIQGWKSLPSTFVIGNGASVTIPAAFPSDGLEIEVIATDTSWPGYVPPSGSDPTAFVNSTNIETSPIVNLQVIPATTVTIAESATNQANSTPQAVPAVIPEPIQGHEVVLTATIKGTFKGVECGLSNSDCVAPTPTYNWYREAVSGTQNPATDYPISSGSGTPAYNVSTYDTSDSTYTIGTTVNTNDTLSIWPLSLLDQGYTYYAVAGYAENGVTNFENSNAITLTVNWDQVTSFAVTGTSPSNSYARFDALSVNLPTIYSTSEPTDPVQEGFWIAGGENSTQGVLSTSSIYNSSPNYNTGTDTTSGQFRVAGDFVAGPHLDGTATLFLSGTGTPEIAIVGGSDGQDAQNGIEYFVPSWNTTNYTGGSYVASSGTSPSTLPVTTQHVAALLPNQSILIAGGQNGDDDTFYSNAWLLTPGSTPGSSDSLVASQGQLSVPRASSKATTLNDGRILITGGVGAQGVVNAVDIYDSSTYDENIYVSYPNGSGTPKSQALYNLNDSRLPNINTGGDFFANAIPPAGGYQAVSWATTAPTATLETPRLYHTQTLLNDGRVLITGGIDNNGNVLSSIEIWDPSANPTAYNGYAGGFYPLGATASAPSTTHPGTLLAARQLASAVLLPTGNVLIFGGEDQSGNALTSAEIVNPNWIYSVSSPFDSVWTNSLSQPREQATATLLQSGEVLAAGGVASSNDIGTLGEIYNALQEERAWWTAPTPEYDSDLYLSPNPTFVSTPIVANVNPEGNNNLTDYSWFVQNETGPATVPYTLEGHPAPLSSQATFTEGPTAATYLVESLVTDQYGLSYLLDSTVTSYPACPAGEQGGPLPSSCYTPTGPTCTAPFIAPGAITVTGQTGSPTPPQNPGTLEFEEANTISLNLNDVTFGTFGTGAPAGSTTTYAWEVSGGQVAEATFPETSTSATITPEQQNTGYTITVVIKNSSCGEGSAASNTGTLNTTSSIPEI
jgi:hypothetical protein